MILTVLASVIVYLKKFGAEHLVPYSYRPEQRARSRARSQFSQYIRSEIERLNRSENWRDDEFSELEAEVEASGRRTGWRSLLRNKSIFREGSLSQALEKSAERLILLEGEPGVGKSVSLRHVVHHTANVAARSGRLDTILPIYVNLKDIKRTDGENIDHLLIKKAVLSSLRRINDRFIDEFIDLNFDDDLRDGRWLFVFDSFDEIPDILSSTENDNVITLYSEAISDFLGGMNHCRGMVASRAYRGPQAQNWTTFRILPLTWKRQCDLISKSFVNSIKASEEVKNGILNASSDVRAMARNPMMLGLLCEHVRMENKFPKTSFEVFSKYIAYRFERDAERVRKRFSLSKEQLERCAAIAAFCMTADSNIGLTPTIGTITRAATKLGFADNIGDMPVALRALAYMRLGRLGEDSSEGTDEFTFSHRRFQEYLATDIVLANPTIMDSRLLLSDGRWRETAVVLLQTHAGAARDNLLSQAYNILTEAVNNIQKPVGPEKLDTLPIFVWGEKELHILGIIQAGHSSEGGDLPADLSLLIAERLKAASASENLLDKKLALDVAGAAPADTLVELMQGALQTKSQWISDVVYRQASRLAQPVPAVYKAIQTYIVRLLIDRRIDAEFSVTKAFIARLPQSEPLLQSLKLARLISIFDRYVFIFFLVLMMVLRTGNWKVLVALIPISFLSKLIPPKAWASLWIREYLRIIALTLAVISIAPTAPIDPTFKIGLVKDQMIAAALLAYVIVIFPSGILCIKNNVLISPYALPIMPFGMLVLFAVAFVKKTKKAVVMMAVSIAIIAGMVYGTYLLAKIFDPTKHAALMLLTMGGTFITIGLIFVRDVWKEATRYRKWLRDQRAFEPTVFGQYFQEMSTAFIQTKMLAKLKVVPIDSEIQIWIELTATLIKHFSKNDETFNLLQNSKFLKSETAQLKFEIKPKANGQGLRSIDLLLNQNYRSMRCDMLYMSLERFSQIRSQQVSKLIY